MQQISSHTNPAQIQCLDEAGVTFTYTALVEGTKPEWGSLGSSPQDSCPHLLPLNKAQFAQGQTAYLSGIWMGLEECSILISSC